MSRLRGADLILDAVTTTNAGVKSAVVNVGSATHVILLVRNNHGSNAITVKVEVGSGDPSAGRNSLPDTASDEWYTLLKKDGSGVMTFNVAANDNVAIDLSPFAGAYARLLVDSTVDNSHGSVTAWASVTG